MDTGLITSHDFEEKKKLIKSFSESAQSNTALTKMDEKKSAGQFWGDIFLGKGISSTNYVTGEDFNDHLTEILRIFSEIKNTQNTIIKEFGHVYGALEALDQDYIKYILLAVDEIQKNSESLAVEQKRIEQLVVDGAKRNQMLQEQQNKIDEVTRNNTKTLETLKIFKKKLDGYSHLKDIDKVWKECQAASREITAFKESFHKQTEQFSKQSDKYRVAIEVINKELDRLSKLSDLQATEIQKAASFIDALHTIEHLNDIDAMWELLTSVHASILDSLPKITALENTCQDQSNRLAHLQIFIEKLMKLDHLEDIDALWEYSNAMKGTVTELIATSENHTNELDKLRRDVDGNITAIEGHANELDKLRQDVDGNITAIEGHANELDKLRRGVDGNIAAIEGHANELEAIHEETRRLYGSVQENKKALLDLFSYKTVLCDKEHLNDVDDTWTEVQNHSEQLEDLKEQDLAIQNKFEAALAKATEETNATIKDLTQKIKYSYLLAGGAIGVALIELALLL